MTRTFADLKTDVQNYVIDLPTTVQNAVPRLVNNAIRSIQRKYNFRAMETSTTFVTVQDILQLGQIANFKEYRDKGPYLLRQHSLARKLLTGLVPDVDQAVLSDIDLPNMPQYLTNTVDVATGVWTFFIAPYPDQLSDWDDGAYRIVVPSYIYTDDLVNPGDINWFTTNADDYIIEKATAEAFGLDWDYDGMTLHLQRAEEKFKEIKMADKYNRLGSVDTLVPMWRGANQPQVRK